MNKGTIRLLSLILGIFLVVISFFITNHLLQFIIINIGIIILIISCVIERQHKKIAILIYSIIIFSIAQFFDYLTIKYFNKPPILTYNVMEFNNVKIYDSFFYRVWQCNTEKNEYIVDDLQKIGYFCNMDYIESTNINNYAVELVSNFSRYYNTYIKLNGIVYDVNEEFIILKSYIYKDEKLIFNDNLTIKIYLNSSFNNIKKNQEIEVTGKVIEINDKVVYLDDTTIS